jgi:hypothetical protein
MPSQLVLPHRTAKLGNARIPSRSPYTEFCNTGSVLDWWSDTEALLRARAGRWHGVRDVNSKLSVRVGCERSALCEWRGGQVGNVNSFSLLYSGMLYYTCWGLDNAVMVVMIRDGYLGMDV